MDKWRRWSPVAVAWGTAIALVAMDAALLVRCGKLLSVEVHQSGLMVICTCVVVIAIQGNRRHWKREGYFERMDDEDDDGEITHLR